MNDELSQAKSLGPLSARAVAILVLARLRQTDAYLNVVLDAALDEYRLADARDAGFVTELCYGSTRREMTIDDILVRFVDRRLEQIEDKVLAALRLGIYQLVFLKTPAHAAVADTVEGLKRVGLARAAGFVNAILREVGRTLAAAPKAFDVDNGNLALSTSHPQWLVERWQKQFGVERASSMLQADNVAPPLVLRANTAKVDRDALVAEFREVGVEVTPTVFSKTGFSVTSPGKVEALFGYDEGRWQVQDEAAQLVTEFAQIPVSARVLDVCAAPGGKTCHLAADHQVVSVDVYRNKLHLIDAEVRRLQLKQNVRLEAHDATKAFPEAWGEFGAVLVDAPCSGLGTLRRHPELRYRRKEADLPALAQLQRSILENAQAVVAPGGLLIYAVCSVDAVEGIDQVELFLRSHPEFTSEPPTGLAHLPTVQGYLRTLPGPEGMDGFFAARFRRMY